MSVVIKTSEILYRDKLGNYHGINSIAEKKIADQIADLDSAIASWETRIDNDIENMSDSVDLQEERFLEDIAQMQSSVDNIESQKDTMIASIASVAGQGTDTTLTQSGVAADAKTTGDRLSSLKKNEISILFVGNSLTQDGIAYLPYLLKQYYPEISFKFYMWYNGGKTLAQQYSIFTSNASCDIFSVAENTGSWTNYNNSKMMSDILATYTFDIVCMQEYFNYKSSYGESDLVDWTNCQNYIRSHYTGGNALKFVSLFHAPLRASADAVYNRTLEGNKLILQKTISEDIIPIGIAVYRALSTTLDSLGDSGHLSPDGTHTQEGLPCLLQTFVALQWLFDKVGINKSVYGHPFRMTTAIYDTIHVPGPNLGSGVITGTAAENILAQEVAIKAYKEGKYYVQNYRFDLGL